MLKGFTNLVLVGLVLPLLTRCASLSSRETLNSDTALSPAAAAPLPTTALSTPSSPPNLALQAEAPEPRLKPVEIENLTIDEVIRIEEPNTQNLYDDSRYDFPITMNSRVEGWIDYFTGRGRSHMVRYLARSSRYIPTMKAILKQAGLPEDLVYLALIESGFNLRAKSRARAVGPWQFMKATGQRYGLRVDAWIDERRDPIRATEAAARYLKDLYLMFESWYLAASAYNAGEYKILRAIEELKTNNYWRICQTNFLRRETKDYVPKLIAAAIIARNANRYGFSDVEYEDPLEFETITVDFAVSLREIASLIDVPLEDIEDLNPELRRSMVPPGLTYELRVPSGTKALSERAIASLKDKSAPLAMPTQHLVKPGETLASLSRLYRIRVGDLANANNLSPKEKISPGTALIIPRKERSFAPPPPKVVARRAVSARADRKPDSGGSFITHVVRRGESLWSIAEKYNVTVQELFRWNNLKRSRINAGVRLKIRKADGDSDEA